MVFGAFTLLLTVHAAQPGLLSSELKLDFLLLLHEGVYVPLDFLVEIEADARFVIDLDTAVEALLLRFVSHLLKTLLLFAFLNRLRRLSRDIFLCSFLILLCHPNSL